MGKVRASYLVRVTVRDGSDDEELHKGFEAPTNQDVSRLVRDAIRDDISERHDAAFEVSVSSERTDR